MAVRYALRRRWVASISLGIMTSSLKIVGSPITAFFDELLVLGFVEGQNLKVDGGFGLRGRATSRTVAAAMAKSLTRCHLLRWISQMHAPRKEKADECQRCHCRPQH